MKMKCKKCDKEIKIGYCSNCYSSVVVDYVNKLMNESNEQRLDDIDWKLKMIRKQIDLLLEEFRRLPRNKRIKLPKPILDLDRGV